MRKITTTKASAANAAPIAIPAILALERVGADSAAGRIGGGVAEADEDVSDVLAIVIECVLVDGELETDDDVDEREVVERDVDELVDLMVDAVVEVIKVKLRVGDRKEEVFLLE